MEDKLQQKRRKANPQDRANFLSKLFFCWEIPLFIKGLKKSYNEDDMYACIQKHESQHLGDKLEKFWEHEENFKGFASLSRVFIRMFGLEFLVYGILFFPMEFSISICQPILLGKLLDYYTPNQTEVTRQQAYLYAFLIIALFFIRIIVIHWFRYSLVLYGMKFEAACSSLIYRKALQMKKSSFNKIALGQIVNLLTNDIRRFKDMFLLLHHLFGGPLELILMSLYLHLALGPFAVTGMVVIVMLLLFQASLSKVVASKRLKVAQRSDYRIRLMNDVICGIKIIKMYAWEKPYMKLVETARSFEMEQVERSNFIRIFTHVSVFVATKISIFVCILCVVLGNIQLTPQYVYVVTSVYQRLTVKVRLTLAAVQLFGEFIASIRRIQDFLTIGTKKSIGLVKKNKDLQSDCIPKTIKIFQVEIPGIYAHSISIRCNKSSPNNILTEVNFEASPEELVGVIGGAGSGKSILLQTFLKEIEIVKGHLHIGGKISYASQEPWIFSASVKQNILFGEEIDVGRYHTVIRACALEHDLSLLPYGDQTLVGERGVRLSGGQKARINLARAVYRSADIYLLDDPLSAVDGLVARHIINECLLKFLKSKCVVLVTNQLNFLKDADRVYHLEAGRVKPVEKDFFKDRFYEKSIEEDLAIEERKMFQTNQKPAEIKEHRTTNANSKNVYRSYFTVDSITGGLILSLFILKQFVTSLIDYFLSFWVNITQELLHFRIKIREFFTADNCLYIYGIFLLLLILILYIFSWIYIRYCTAVSIQFYSKMLTQVIRSPISFFNQHSSGRILNRFSTDFGLVDETIPSSLLQTLDSFFNLVGSVVLITLINYWMIIAALVMFLIFYCFCFVFQRVIRDLKRTEGITRSPIFTHLASSLQGLTTIRAYGVQKILEKEFHEHQNLNNSASCLSHAFYYALGFWVDVVTTIYAAVVILSFFWIEDDYSQGDVALCITEAMALVGTFQYGVKIWGALDTQMASIERIVDYIELPTEPDEGTCSPPRSWPNRGDLFFQSVSLRYSPDLPCVLKNVSFRIQAGEKIGIVGRTGAGKTSLISTLFRLYHFEGQIFIDGVDSESIPLEMLRSNISTIPQEPIFFVGTLRKNLDPFDGVADLQIWNALDEVGLKEKIASLPQGLEALVSEGGSNFSAGERQLLCLVRVMLKKSKIIVLDEATASVDSKTDELIQSTIRRKFRECTVLTIAHRLDTIMDSDKILVLEAGRLAEFDSPNKLLENKKGVFYNFANRGLQSNER